jgi:predicted transcriptional regulator
MVELNENELEALRILWDKPPQKPAEVQAEFGWEIDNGTLRSVLVGMVESGLLRRRKAGKAFVYSPRVPRETHLRRMIAKIADVYAEGSTAKLLMELVSREELSADELDRLRRIAEGRED